MNRHVEALAEEFLGRGHDVRVLAPFDPPGRVSRLLHRAAPEPRELPDYLTPLGRTMGFGVNGSVGNLAPFPTSGVLAPRREVRRERVRRDPRPRAAGAPGRLERDPGGEDAGRRHLPRLLDQADAQLHRQRARRPPHVQPPRRPDRRLRGGRLDRPPLVRRRLHDHPQRGRHRHSAERAVGTGGGAADPLRRPPRGAQGPADPADRLRRPGRARALPPHRDRGRARGRAPLPRRPRAAALDRHPRPRLRRQPLGRAARAPTCSAPPRSPARASAWC